MPNLTTNGFRVHATEQMHESLFEPTGTQYYTFAARPEPWPNESQPVAPTNSQRSSSFDVYDTMLFGKAVTQNDVAFMVPRYPWEAGTVYAMFDDIADDLYDSNFFVVVDSNTEYHVFKCLDNNFGAPSTVAPSRSDTSEDDEYYSTSDGYQWKYMYSMPASTYNKFATTKWIPVVPNANTQANATPGAIDVIVVENPGTQFNSYANGYFTEIAVNGDTTVYGIDSTSSANTDFYKNCAIKIVEGVGKGQQGRIAEYSVQGGFKRLYLMAPFQDLPNQNSKYEITPHVTITGDGANCVARAIVDPVSNTVAKIEITQRGQGYTYASASVVGNTGIIVSGNTAVQANNAVLRPIIGPSKGHGANINKELGATGLGFSVTFANTEQLTIPAEGKFRQIGLMRDPMFANVEFTIANVIGSFVDEEEIYSPNTSSTGVVTYYNEPTSVLRMSNTVAGFSVNNTVIGRTSNAHAVISSFRINGSDKPFTTFDQRVRLDTSFNGTAPFTPGQHIRQQITDAQAIVHTSNTTFTALTEVRGTINITNMESSQYISSDTAVANVNAIVSGDLVKASGEVLYIENIQPVTRGEELAETVKFIIRF